MQARVPSAIEGQAPEKNPSDVILGRRNNAPVGYSRPAWAGLESIS
jgi:hypothetical protein